MDKRLLIQPYTIIDATSGEDAFSRVFAYQPEHDDMRAAHGELYVVFSASVPGVETDWEQVATELFEQFKDRYYAEASVGIQHDLEEAVNICTESFERTVRQLLSDATNFEIELQVGALVMWGGSFVYHSAGKVYFALVRNGALVDMAGDRFVQEVIQDGDAFLLGTTVFGQRIDSTVVQHVMQSNAGEDWQKALRDEVKDVEAGALLSGIVLNVQTETIPDEDDVIELKMSGNPSEEAHLKQALKSNTTATPLLHRLKQMAGVGIAAIWGLLPRPRADAALYVEKDVQSHAGKKWLVVFGLVLLLFASIFITYLLNKRKDRMAHEEQATAELIAGLQRVEELRGYDQVQAKRAFELLQEQMGQVQGVSDSLEDQFQQTYNTLYAVRAVTWTPYEAGFGANTRVVASGATVIAVDADTGTIRTLLGDGTYEDQGQTNEFIGVSYIVPGPEGVYGYHTQTGLWFYSFSSRGVEQIMTQSGRWGNAKGMDFYEDNIYILAPEVQDLVKYIGLGGGRLSGGTSYFVDPLDFAAIIDVAIDGHIFTLSENNFVEKFLAGRRVEFTLHGVYPSGQSYRSITTGVGYDNLYIATDTELFVFSVEGEYRNIFTGPGTSIKAFTVNADESFVVIVTETGLLRASL